MPIRQVHPFRFSLPAAQFKFILTLFSEKAFGSLHDDVSSNKKDFFVHARMCLRKSSLFPGRKEADLSKR